MHDGKQVTEDIKCFSPSKESSSSNSQEKHQEKCIRNSNEQEDQKMEIPAKRLRATK